MNGLRTARAYGDLLALLIGGVLVLAGAAWFGLWHPSTARLDDDIHKAYAVPVPPNTGVVHWVFDHIDAGPILLVTFACAVAALVQRQLRLTLAIPAFTGTALWLNDYLKASVFERSPGTPMVPLSLPSGHTTAGLVLAVGLVFALPRVARPLGSLVGGFVAGAVGIGVLAWQWHRPSDVVASCGVVLALAGIALAAAARYTSRPRARAAGFDRAVGHPALGVVGAGLAFWRWWAGGVHPLPGSRAHTLFFGTAAVVCVVIGVTVGLCAVAADRHLLPGSTWWPTRTRPAQPPAGPPAGGSPAGGQTAGGQTAPARKGAA